MYVPPRYVPIVGGRRFSPRELWTDLVGPIRADNKRAECQELVNWCMHALMRASAANPQLMQSPPPEVPIADAALASHRRAILYRQLPNTDPVVKTRASNVPTQLVQLVGQLVTNQRQAQDDERDRLDAAKMPKSPATY
ncbi:hypothetical protein ACA910_010601 [Epithemia clementina (nom. ined.)]